MTLNSPQKRAQNTALQTYTKPIGGLDFKIKLDGFGEDGKDRITLFDDNQAAYKLFETFLRNIANSSPETAKTYYYFLRGFLYYASQQSLSLDQIEHEHCQDYIDLYKARNKKEDRRREPDPTAMFSTVKRLMKWYVEHEIIESDPTRRIAIKSRTPEYGYTQPVTMDDIKRMLDTIGELKALNTQASRDKCLIATLSYTGLRISALLGCRVSDLTRLNEGYAVLAVREKGQEERLVPVIPECLAYIDAHIEHCALSLSDFLFQRIFKGGRLSGQAITRNATRKMLIKRAEASGIDTSTTRITNHTFRATFATNYLRAGGDINFAKRTLGHKSIDTTNRYDHRELMELAKDIAEKMGS